MSHVVWAGFGLDIDFQERLVKLSEFIRDIEENDGERIDSITWQILARRAYDETFEIIREGDVAANPLASVSMSPKEDTITNGPLENRIWRYSKYDIEKRFHLSLVEFLSLPKHLVEYLLFVSGKEMEKEAPDLAKAKQKLDALEKGTGKK